MSDVVDYVTQTMLGGSMLIALPVAFLAGLISFASPCILPLIPGYVGYLGAVSPLAASPEVGANPQRITLPTTVSSAPSASTNLEIATIGAHDEKTSRRYLTRGVIGFVWGFSTVFVTIAIVLSAVNDKVLAYYHGLIFEAGGLLLIIMAALFAGLGVARSEKPAPEWGAKARRQLAVSGAWAGPLTGAIFGLTWSPCIGPTLAAVLTLALIEGSVIRAAILAFVYCLGLGVPFALVALGMEKSRRLTAFLSRHGRAIQLLGAVVLGVIGVLMVVGLWQQIAVRLADLVVDRGLVL